MSVVAKPNHEGVRRDNGTWPLWGTVTVKATIWGKEDQWSELWEFHFTDVIWVGLIASSHSER